MVHAAVSTSVGSALICLVLPSFTCLVCRQLATTNTMNLDPNKVEPTVTKVESTVESSSKPPALSTDKSPARPMLFIMDKEWQVLLILETVLLNLAWFAFLALQCCDGDDRPFSIVSQWVRVEPLAQAVMLLGSVQAVVHFCVSSTASGTVKGNISKLDTLDATANVKDVTKTSQQRPTKQLLPVSTTTGTACTREGDVVVTRFNPDILAELKSVNAARHEVDTYKEVMLCTAVHVTVASRSWAEAYYVAYRRLEATQHVRIYSRPSVHQQLIRQAKDELLERLESIIIHRAEF